MIDVKLKLTIDEDHEEYFEKIMKIITLIPGVEKAESFDYIEYNNEDEPCWAEEHSSEIQEKLEELKAFEKETAKKPERLNTFRSIGKCGGCEKVISTRTASVYCQYCGNKVDWGNED